MAFSLPDQLFVALISIGLAEQDRKLHHHLEVKLLPSSCSAVPRLAAIPQSEMTVRGPAMTYTFQAAWPFWKLHTTLLLISPWLELRHMAVSVYKGSWEMWYLF